MSVDQLTQLQWKSIIISMHQLGESVGIPPHTPLHLQRKLDALKSASEAISGPRMVLNIPTPFHSQTIRLCLRTRLRISWVQDTAVAEPLSMMTNLHDYMYIQGLGLGISPCNLSCSMFIRSSIHRLDLVDGCCF